jgi:O-antigen/teichoic acid export membrane protein
MPEIAPPCAEAAPALAVGAELRGKVSRSSKWTVGGLGAANLLRLGSNVVLSYLLLREDFGLMVLVSTFVMGLGMFSDVGVGPCIVHSRRGDDPRFLNTAWSLQILRGFLLFGLAVLLADPFTRLFASAEHPGYQALAQVLPVAALQAVLQGFNSTKIFTAERHLALARKVQGDLAGQVAAIVVMVAWAWLSPTVWALVAGTLTQALVIMLWSHFALPGERNRLGYDRVALAELLHFGRWIFLSTAVTFFALQIDKLVLGAKVPEAVLGVYGQAVAIVNLPQFLGGVLTGQVIFPLLAAYARSEPAQLRARFEQSRTTLLRAALVLSMAVLIFSPVFFRVFYKPEYHAAGWMAPLMMLASWFFLLSVTSDRALLARGDSRALALSNLVSFLGKLAGGWFGFQQAGLPGFILGLALGTLLGHVVVQIALAAHGLPIHCQDLRYTLIALLVGGLSYLLNRRLETGRVEVLSLALQAAIGLLACGPLTMHLYRRIRTQGVAGG